MAEMERGLLIERTQAGLARAKVEGKVLGRPTKTTAHDQAKIVELHAAGQSLSMIAAPVRDRQGRPSTPSLRPERWQPSPDIS